MRAINKILRLKNIAIIAILILFTFHSLLFTNFAQAGELEDIEKELANLSNKLEQSQSATAPLETTLKGLEQNLANIQDGIKRVEASFKDKERKIDEGDKNLTQKQVLLEKRIREFFIKDKRLDSLTIQMLFGTKASLGETIRLAGYNKRVLEQDRNEIVQLVLFIKNLEEKKEELKSEKVRLAIVKEKTDEQAAFFRKEVAGAKAYQSDLQGQIAQLSARQQSILSARLGNLNLPISLGAGALFCTDDRKIDPGFSPALAFYTYGIPHRVGMNQYGALGRAQAGQNAEAILNAYYSFDGSQQIETTINVNDGNGYDAGNVIWSGNLEEYIKRIYEVPASWPSEALKAQAIAARSYVIAQTDRGRKSICANQYCQVFKTDPKGGAWEQAVNDTAGKVLTNGGEIIIAWYSSTDGGYTYSSADVWGSNKSWTKRTQDTNGSANSFEDLNSKAYDKDSPCFYAAQGSRGEYGKSAWLKPNEVADIANVIMLAKKDSNLGDHFYQTDKAHPYGGEVWNEDKVKQELRSRGGSPIDNATSVSVGADFGNGRTTSVNINGISFNGDEFKSYFNLRAPANIQIVGPLYNIERK